MEKSVYAFIENDEVYKIGDKEPVGMVIRLNTKTISVRLHSNGKTKRFNPKILYRGIEWQEYNK